MRTLKRYIGFTLLEMVIVITILGIVTVASTKSYQVALNAYWTNSKLTRANAEANLIINNLTRHIRMIRSSSDITTATSTNLVFTDVNNATMTYQYTNTADTPTTLTLNTQNLATHVSSFTFNYMAQNGTTTATLSSIRYIQASFTITISDVSYSYRVTVYPRNIS